MVRLGEEYERYLDGPEPAVLSGGTIYLRDQENNKILCIDTNNNRKPGVIQAPLKDCFIDNVSPLYRSNLTNAKLLRLNRKVSSSNYLDDF